MTELLFIRHGETDFNRQWRFQGHVDTPLNDTGQAQSERLAARLADEPIDLLVTSDLQRTRQTAAPLIRQRGLAAASDSGWREQCFGVLEGLEVATIRDHHPDLWAAWSSHDADLAPPGGESYRQFHARVLLALQALVQAHAGRRIVVITHGGVLDMLWRTAHGLALSGARVCEIPNTGINRLRWQDGRLHIVQWGDAAHLAEVQDLSGQVLKPNTV
jgi:probable phosphoglycerate mutase